MGQIIYHSGVSFLDGDTLPSWAEDRLQGYMTDAGVDALLITSGHRTPYNQARIMYDDYIIKKGEAAARRLYNNQYGNAVVDVWSNNKSASRAQSIANMEAKIRELGPEHISRHVAEDATVFDISPASISPGGGFERLKARMIRAPRNRAWRANPDFIYEIGELLYPPDDDALHVEFPGNSAGVLANGSSDGSGLGVGDVVAGMLIAGVGYKVGKAILARRKKR